jgi:hypothetical protein
MTVDPNIIRGDVFMPARMLLSEAAVMDFAINFLGLFILKT